MSTIMIKFPKDRVKEVKSLVEDGLHIFGRVMGEMEQMCRESESYGDRMDYYGNRYGDRHHYGNREYEDYGEPERYGNRMHMPPYPRY